MKEIFHVDIRFCESNADIDKYIVFDIVSKNPKTRLADVSVWKNAKFEK